MFGFLFGLSGALAANYYVDFSAGSDAANGTSTITPWAHCPGDSLATGTAAAATLAGGDAVIFKGGVEYKSTIALNFSGTAGSAITYDGNSGGTFGSGMAVFNGENSNSVSRVIGFSGSTARSNLNFVNCEFKLFGGHSAITWDCNSLPASVDGQAINLAGAKSVTIRDCYIHDIGDWTNAPFMSLGFMVGDGLKLFGCSSVTVTNCEFTRIGHAAIYLATSSGSLLSSTNNRVLNCRMHDYIRWGLEIACGADGSTLNDLIVDGLSWYNYFQYNPSTWLGCTNLFPHTDGMIWLLSNFPPVRSNTLGTVQSPNIIRNCVFYNDSATANNAGTADIFLTGWGGRMLIYNNIFLNVLNTGEGGIYAQDGIALTNGTSYPDYHFYNNSFFDNTHMIMLQSPSSAGTFALTNGTSSVRVKNNIFYKTNTTFTMGFWAGSDPYSSPTEVDYNIYHTGRAIPEILSFRTSSNTVGTYTLAQAQALGWETHGQYVLPGYANTNYGIGANSSLNDLHLLSSSAAVNAGADLSSFFTTDKDGNTRPAGAWDIGAYEYVPPQFSVGTVRAGRIVRAP